MSHDSKLKQSVLDGLSAFNLKRGDGNIAAAAMTRLASDGAVPEVAISVKLDKGWKTLIGQVVWH